MVVACVVEVIDTVLRGKSWTRTFRDVALTGDVRAGSKRTQEKRQKLQRAKVPTRSLRGKSCQRYVLFATAIQ